MLIGRCTQARSQERATDTRLFEARVVDDAVRGILRACLLLGQLLLEDGRVLVLHVELDRLVERALAHHTGEDELEGIVLHRMCGGGGR